LLFSALAFTCSDGSNPPQPCTDIPEGGCPLSHGVACEDPSCLAVYACRPNDVWELDHVCPPHDAAAHDASDADARADTGPVFDANIDAPPGAFGGPGCNPLEPPDCELGLVLLCQSGCCDCADLYVCQNGGWQIWGTCSPDGGLQQTR
jgi:hypothetical protein